MVFASQQTDNNNSLEAVLIALKFGHDAGNT